MGNTIPGVNEFNGFQAENLAGPAAGLLWKFTTGARSVVGGDPSGIKNMVPTFVKGWLNYFKGRDGTVEDSKGRPLAQGVTPWESTGQLLGLQPKRVSDFNAAQAMKEKSEMVAAKDRGHFRLEVAEHVVNGDVAAARALLREKAISEPHFDVEAEVRRVAKMAEDMTFPRDLRDSSAAPSGKILALFNLDMTAPVETQRLMFRKRVEAMFGLRNPASQRELQEAQLIDRLRLQHPLATRSELRLLAQQQLRRFQTVPSL